MTSITGTVALVTGASRGIGASIAKSLAAAGARVVVNYAASKGAADEVVAAITSSGGEAIAVQGDVSQPASIDQIMTETIAAYGRLDTLVNNAGVFEFEPLEAITPEHFHRQFNINVLGLLLTTQKAVPFLEAAGRGSVINISSSISHAPGPRSSVYSATKAAVDAITRSLAKELGPRRIRVNSINPGMVETEGSRGLAIGNPGVQAFQAEIATSTPLGRIAQPEDIGPVAVFLASQDAGWITGRSLLVDGGHF